MPTPTRILLIDDGPADRAAIGAALAGSNLFYTLVEAGDVAAGLEIADREAFDCVLLDSELAGDVLGRLGSLHPIIALTNGDHADAALLGAGALDTIPRREAAAHMARAIRYAQAQRSFAAELQAARDEAERKSDALGRFNRHTTLVLSILAHDLRNPFQALLGMSELLVHTAAAGSPTVIAGRAAIVHEAATQAHGLMEGLFTWTHLHMDASAEPIRIAGDRLLAEAAQAMQAQADAKGVKIETRSGEVFALAQENATAAILRHLIANALEHTPAGGCVTLAAEPRGERIALIVADTGPGMSEEKAAGLLALESRPSPDGGLGEAGAGLGLLLCRDLAEWISGDLEVESQLGHGATFRLLLPASP